MSPVSADGAPTRALNSEHPIPPVHFTLEIEHGKSGAHIRTVMYTHGEYGDTSDMDDEPADPPHKALRLQSPSPLDHSDLHSDLDPQSLAAASLRNPTDALNLLALAADVDRARKRRPMLSGNDDLRAEHADRSSNEPTYEAPRPGLRQNGSLSDDTLDGDGDAVAVGQSSLADYELIRTGALSVDELIRLTALFFSQVHLIFPMIPHHRIPRTEQQLGAFAKEDGYLLTAIIVIASRQDKKLDIHEKSWNYMQVSFCDFLCSFQLAQASFLSQALISELILGKAVTVGAVEALLLLSGT